MIQSWIGSNGRVSRVSWNTVTPPARKAATRGATASPSVRL
jgi:hypothetical protein